MDEKLMRDHFLQLVLGLQSSGWMMLGKIANPMTGKSEKNLDAAKNTIDTLIMLREKTKGNLDDSEKQMIEAAISQLQVNYVEESANNEKQVESDDAKDSLNSGMKDTNPEEKKNDSSTKTE
ncbi:DUF1844 domain-containing protein [Candidatus Woesearchaeota archaeon]|nr:DUF1844 domain-containing protein [Candidatus Woesearchaeota archaeon]